MMWREGRLKILLQTEGSDDAMITASRIMLCMAATKVIKKERHCTASVVWRSMTTWNEHETNKCWEEVTSILTGELNIGVPMTFVSENHFCVFEHLLINFPSSGSDPESNETGCVRMAHSDTNIMPRIKPMWCDGEMRENATRAEECDGACRDPDGSQTANMLTTWRGCGD